MGAGRISYVPLLDYWMRMASGAFGCLGIASLLVRIRPDSFPGLVRLLGPFHVFMGVALAVAAAEVKEVVIEILHPDGPGEKPASRAEQRIQLFGSLKELIQQQKSWKEVEQLLVELEPLI